LTFAIGAIRGAGQLVDLIQSTEVNMFHPQGNFHSQGSFGYPQGSFGYPQFGYPQGNFGQQGFQGTPNGIPFANTLYGYPQLTPSFQGVPQMYQGVPQVPSWQHPAQQQALLQAALQQQAMQLLAPQLAAQPFGLQNPPGANALSGLSGLANGATQSAGGWQQPQIGPEQINPALQQQSQQHLLQRLAQYHYLVAQQLTQLVAQQAAQNSGNPYTGQFIPGAGPFIPGQLGANFVPGFTMH
jgi:hypothetical protein